MKVSKYHQASLLRHDIARVFKSGELGGHCCFSIICRQFVCRHCWATHAVYAEPHASGWICSICNNINAKITSRWRHCHVRLILLFVL